MFEFKKKLVSFIYDRSLLSPSDRCVLAVSGGADSTALLYAFAALKHQKRITNDLLCVHFNHMLRGKDSDADQQFVARQCDKLGIDAISTKINVPQFATNNKLSIETAARQMRLENFARIASEKNFNVIITAHQSDDNAETLIHRITRGTAYRGLAGIHAKRKFDKLTIISPLLDFSRAQIERYLNSKNIPWRNDASNADTSFTRNYIRHQLLPYLQKNSESSLASLLTQLSLAACQLSDNVDTQAIKLCPSIVRSDQNKISINRTIFNSLHPAVKVEIIRKAFLSLNCPEQKITKAHYQKLLDLAADISKPGKVILPNSFQAAASQNEFILTASSNEDQITIPAFEILTGKTQNHLCYKIESEIIAAADIDLQNIKRTKDQYEEYLDFDKITFPLILRSRKSGDRFTPIGKTQPKKIGKFVTAARVSEQIRPKLLVLEDAEKILWLWPIRLSQSAKADENTAKLLHIRITYPS